MNRRDFYIEFYDMVDGIINGYLVSHNLPSYVGTLLFEGSYQLKARYNSLRSDGLSLSQAIEIIKDAILPKFEITREIIMPKECIPLSGALSRAGNRLAIYVYNTRQLKYMMPFIEMVNRPVVLLCERSVDIEMDMPEYVEAIDLDYSIAPELDGDVNVAVKKMRSCYTLMNSVFSELKVEGVVLLEGCHFQEQIIGEIAREHHFPSILLQQGWPSVMHTMFRRFPYSHFITWGEKFNDLWRRYNPAPEYCSAGYPYPVKPKRAEAVTFFLQAPLFISDEAYYGMFVDLISDAAWKYEHIVVLVREHPEYRMNPKRKKALLGLSNVCFVTDWPLTNVFAASSVVVSHFSSSLIEGMAHECIPLVFDPTTDSRYTPDVEALGLGCIATTSVEFFQKLDMILSEKDTYASNVLASKDCWFYAVDKEAAKNQTRVVNRITPPSVISENLCKLNLGCGRNIMPGWINVDIAATSPGVFTMDVTRPFPFPDNSFDYVFSEHMFEHLDLAGQQNMMRECHRILRPRGVLRLAMPNFDFLVDLVNNPDSEINRRYLDWSYQMFIQDKVEYEVAKDNYPVYVVNNFMHDWNHKFIHNPTTLKDLALSCGFCLGEKFPIGESPNLELQGCEKHQNEIPAWANNLETFVIEFTNVDNNW